MNDLLERLRSKNAGLRLYPVTDPLFEEYGRVIDCADTRELRAALETAPIPESGNTYSASDPALEGTGFAAWIRHAAFGGMEIQAGFCNGRGCAMNAMEYHKCGEVNFTTTGCVLLLALQRDIRDGRLHSRDVVGFYLPPDVLIEVRAEVLHFAPCRVREDGFNCLVVLERGVNSEIEPPAAPARGEAAMLWKRGKWLLAHPEGPQAALGAYVGIDGENLSLDI